MSEKDVAAFWKMYLETEEIISCSEEILGRENFWKGYLKALKNVGVEVLKISKSKFDDLTFDFKLRVARGLREKYPYAEIGFVYGAVHYTVEEIDALEGLRNLF